jgi:hypothetical protein
VVVVSGTVVVVVVATVVVVVGQSAVAGGWQGSSRSGQAHPIQTSVKLKEMGSCPSSPAVEREMIFPTI